MHLDGWEGSKADLDPWIMDPRADMEQCTVHCLRLAGQVFCILGDVPGSQELFDRRKERMTARTGRRLQLLPRVVADVDPTILWHLKVRLRLIEEIASGRWISVTDAPGREEAMRALIRSLGRDWKAEEKDILATHIAEAREWLQALSESQLLIDLCGRAAQRREGSGSPDDSRRLPFHEEGLRVARALVADIMPTDRLDSEQESVAVSNMLADLLLPPWAYSLALGCNHTSDGPSPAGSISTPLSASVRN